MKPRPEVVECPTGSLVDASAWNAAQQIRLSVVIPTLNERMNVAELVRRLTELLDPELPAGYELIIVEDDSPDRAWEVAAGSTRAQLIAKALPLEKAFLSVNVADIDASNLARALFVHHPDFFTSGKLDVWGWPLANYILTHFNTIGRTGDYQFMIRNERQLEIPAAFR